MMAVGYGAVVLLPRTINPVGVPDISFHLPRLYSFFAYFIVVSVYFCFTQYSLLN